VLDRRLSRQNNIIVNTTTHHCVESGGHVDGILDHDNDDEALEQVVPKGGRDGPLNEKVYRAQQNRSLV